MIIRSYFKCSTCGHPHIIRIGMGQEVYQKHTIQCRNCGEEMVVALCTDYEKLSAIPEAVDNAVIIEKTENGSVVNVHANFVIPENQRYRDGVFPHLEQMHDIAVAAEKRQHQNDLQGFPYEKIGARPYRRPDFGDEWKILKKAWNLHRNNKDKLARKFIKTGSARYYSQEPLDDIRDWIWRFVMMIGGAHYGQIFDNAIKSLQPLGGDPRLAAFFAYYDAEMADVRSVRYRDAMVAFFSGYSEFNQVLLPILANVAPPIDCKATSNDFNSVRMFYGNTYEAFSSSVDILAYLNNLQSGREYSTFSQMTQQQYLKLDKPKRFNAFALNQPFTRICEETDNQIRNASHHGSFFFDAETQLITYRSGKGGTGPERKLTYTEYLLRSSRLFLQLMVLYRMELLMCQKTGAKFPI